MNTVREAAFAMARAPYGKTNTQYHAEFDPATGTIWGYFTPRGTPCFSLGLLKDLRMHDTLLETNLIFVDLLRLEVPIDQRGERR